MAGAFGQSLPTTTSRQSLASTRVLPVSLRSILATVMILAAVLAVLVSGALVALTTILHRATVSRGSSVESVRLAEKAEIALLLHERARDGLVKRDIEGDLRSKLLGARQFVMIEHESRMLAEAESQVDSYIAASRDPQRTAELAIRQEAAFGALEALIAINVAQSKTAPLESRGDEVELRVTDHSIGIAECDRARMFEPFRRVGLSKETAPGAGLGLFIVRQIVEAHRGRIEVESAPGQGSTFRVFLPVDNTAP